MDDDDLLGGPPAGGGGFDDDLLGGGSPTGGNDLLGGGGGGFDDDLLGGGGGIALDDDLLFGGPSNADGSQASGQVMNQQQAGGGGSITKRHKIKISPMSEAPQALHPFLTPTTYFARFMQMLDREGNRVRRVFAVTDEKVVIYTEYVKIEWQFPVYGVLGVLEQEVTVSKFMGKDQENLILLVVDEDPDLLMAQAKDPGNGENTAFRDLATVLVNVCAAYEVDVSCCTLKPTENIKDYMKKCPIDFRVRQALCETLADRSELLKELEALQKQERQLEMAVQSIKGSKDGQVVADIVRENQQFDMLVTSIEAKTAEVNHLREAAEARRAKLIDQLAEEKDKRDNAVKDNVEEATKNRLLKQVADYEVRKASHKRDMDRIQKVAEVLERRVKDRERETYNNQMIGIRIELLEKQLSDIQQLAVTAKEDHGKRLSALSANRERMEICNDLLKVLPDDIKLLEMAQSAIDQQLPSNVLSLELPDISPIEDIRGSIGSSAQQPAKVESKKEPEDQPKHVDPIVQERTTAPPPASKPPIINDSDDDI